MDDAGCEAREASNAAVQHADTLIEAGKIEATARVILGASPPAARPPPDATRRSEGGALRVIGDEARMRRVGPRLEHLGGC